MRTWDYAARLGLCAISAACAITGMSGSRLMAQDILPSVRFDVAEGDWDAAGSWVVAGSDPAVNRLPNGDEIVAVNSGTALVNSAASNIATLGVRGGGVVSLESGGSLTVDGDAIIGPGGTLRYAGGELNANSLIFTGGIDIASAAAGDITFGKSWQVANSANVLGGATSVTLDGEAPGGGVRLVYGTNDTGATVSVSNEPLLTIDRATGNASIDNVFGAALDLKGYSVTSGNGSLGDTWNSLADQSTAGWAEANSTDTRFTEYSLSGATSVDAGGSLGIGKLLDQFGPPTTEDVGFEYILGDGSVGTGLVEYVGPINDLVLQIDPETGSAAISHQAALLPSFDVIAYTISSASGSLNTEAFSGIGSASGWSITNPKATALTELNLNESTTFSTGTDINLGNIFSGEQDLVFQYATEDGNISVGTVSYENAVVGPTCSPINSLLGDLDGDKEVGFSDFLILSGNFGKTVGTYEEGDIDCGGDVAFGDFLTLSGNFGNTIARAQAVPEPTSGLLTLTGLIGGILMFRRNRRVVSCVLLAVVATALVGPETAMAQELDARFIRLHPDSPNGLSSITESLGVLDGSVIDIIVNEDISGTYDEIDFAGGAGVFATNSPYLNGVTDESMDNFLTYLSGSISLNAGDYTIGCGSDDGCYINMPGVSFITTYNEALSPTDINSGPTTAGDGILMFNPGRGHDWTLGTFTVPQGGITTSFEALSNEGGGGDSFEIAITDFHPDPEFVDDDLSTGDLRRAWVPANMELFADNAVSGLSISGGAFEPGPQAVYGDFNADGQVNSADADILQANMFSDGSVSNGDINGDGVVNFNDLSAFAPVLEAAGAVGAAQSVPEPASSVLALLGVAALLAFRRKR